MIRKGVYSYGYMGRWKISEEKMLPLRNVSYNKLNMKGISDNDHEHTELPWKKDLRLL